MRVGLDLTTTLVPRPSGTSLYALALTEALGAVAPELERVACYRLSAALRHQQAWPAPLPSRVYLDACAPLLARSLDVFHGLVSRAARFRPKRQVVTIHDVVHLWLPGFRDEPGADRRKAQYEHVRRAADAILTPSAFERDKVVEHLQVAPERVQVVPLAPAPSFRAVTRPDPALLSRYGLRTPYVLFVGVAQPRKNVVRLAEALAHLPEEVHLAMAGPVLPSYAQELGRALAPLGERAHLLGYVPNPDLPGLYASAQCLVLASTYESFGIPVLEAMACGCPVVCSNAAALPEVAGGAALLFDPSSTEALTAALLALVGSPALQERLRAQGLERARQYSYARTALETMRLYRLLA